MKEVREMRRNYRTLRKELVKKLEQFQKVIDEAEKEHDTTFIYYEHLSDIEECIRKIRHAIRIADFYHARKRYTKALNILQDVLENTPDLPFFQ